VICATLWDFGGVLTTSPFEAFARYEEEHGLPAGFIRGLNAANHHDNAWAQLERGDVDFERFCELFEGEAREAGGDLVAADVMGLLSGRLRPEMVEALRRCRRAGLRTGCLTNNFAVADGAEGANTAMAEVLELFDAVVESRRTGVRKPDPKFYELACQALEIEPQQAVFLDDLGINLKPAREMGMATIKVVQPATALAELEALVGIPLRD
jgi:putative hydrolase of the HAD superfamily